MIKSVGAGMYMPQAQGIQGKSAAKTDSVKEASSTKEASATLSPKAAAIAQQIASGEYKLDMKATAKAMASDLVC